MTKKLVRYNREPRPRRTYEHDFPKGEGGLVFCKICNAVYFKKSWHHSLRYHKKLREDLPVKFSLCPACVMIKSGTFEGRILMKNVQADIRENLLNLIHAFTYRAFKRDPMDRLIDAKSTRDGLEVTTTENQLAVKLAKKIKDVYKKARMNVSYGHAKDKASYITIEFIS